MKRAFQIENIKKGLVFFLGLLVALFVVAQEVSIVPCEITSEAQEQSDADQDQEDQEKVYEHTFDALPPASGVTIEPFQAILLAEINFESEEQDFPETEVPLCDSPYYKTLFRQIISPNAP